MTKPFRLFNQYAITRSLLTAVALLSFVLGGIAAAQVPANQLPTVPKGAFNFVALPDTQQYSESEPEIFHAETQWIVDNLESQQIKFVSQLGDIVDNLQVEQWEVARAAMERLHGKVPYGISVGNHDMTATDTSMFQQYFPASRFDGFDWYGGSHENNTSSYQLFSAAGKDYLAVHLPCNAPDGALAWAAGVMNRYADRKVIVSTHMYLGPIKKPANGKEYFTLPRGRMKWKKRFGKAGNTPQQMWEKCFRNHKNLVLILCGDQSRSQAMHRTVRGLHGNTVHEVLSDYRDGYLRLYTFMPNGETIRVTTYSPHLNKICTGTPNAPDPAEHVFTLRPAAANSDDWPAIRHEAKPWAYWWWMGSAVNKKDITRLFEKYKKAGMGGSHIVPIYGAKGYEKQFIDYLSPRWMEMLDHSVAEGKRLGLGVDMTTGTGWCFGGPLVSDRDADAEVIHRTISVSAGKSPQGPFDPKSTQALVAYSDGGDVVELTDKIGPDGKVDWLAPAGKWTVHAVSQKPSGRRVKRSAPGGGGYMLNPFYGGGMTRYLQWFAKSFDAYEGQMPRAMYHDSYEYKTNWGPDLFDQFEKRRGYRLQRHLPALFEQKQCPRDTIARVKADYRQTVSDIITDEYIGQWDAWANARKMRTRNQAHGSPGNLLDIYAAADIPATEMFNRDRDPLVAKFASSAAHVTGKSLVSAEYGTWLKEHFTATLADLKYLADDMFLGGINHLFYHGNAYSPAAAAWPGWCFYASTEMNPRNAIWRDVPTLNRYIGRVQTIFQANRPSNDILLYWPIHDTWHDSTGLQRHLTVHYTEWLHDYAIGRVARAFWKKGHTFDYVSDRQLKQAVAAKEQINVPGGAYRVVVVPECKHIPVETFAKLLALAADGATVIFEKALPDDVPGLAKLAQRRMRLNKLKNSLHTRPVAKDKDAKASLVEAKHGAGHVLVGNVEASLQHAGIRRETMVDHDGIRFIRSKNKAGVDYFVANRGETPLDDWVALAVPTKSVLLMDPLSGKIGAASLRQKDGQVEVLLKLAPGESMIVRALANQNGADPNGAVPKWNYLEAAGEPVVLKGTWQVEFVDGGPVLPPALKTNILQSWTKLGGKDVQKEVKRFAGTAKYRLTFDAPQQKADTWLLDLGRVAESARVTLNGKALGTLILAPFQVEINNLRHKGNVLEVEVTNLSANRLRDLDARKVAWRNFYNINFVSITRKPFDASKWPIYDSGLLGPVTIRPMVPCSRSKCP